MRKIRDFSKSQKIVLIIIFSIIAVWAIYFIYLKDDNMFETFQGENIILNENTEESNKNIVESKSEDEKLILIHITGAVQKSGLIEIKQDSRIQDAINAAGGLTSDADIKDVNLAYQLEDGMKIYIPFVGEKNDVEEEQIVTSENGSQVIQNNKDTKNTNSTEKININTATQTELETLPGIGPSTALKIINYRQENGKYNSIEDIKNVSGIGDAKYENIKSLIVVK